MVKMPRILATVPVYNAVAPAPYITHLILSQESGKAEAAGRYSLRWCVPGPKAKVVVARNHSSQICLSGGGDYLLLIDDDMVVPHDMVDQLLRHDVDIISPIFFRSMPPIEPLIFDLDELGNPMPIMDYPADQLFETPGGSGTGVMLIKRKVLEAMEVPIWIGTIDPTVGEDVLFCRRARDLGFRSWCDSSVKVSQMSVAVPVGEKQYMEIYPGKRNLQVFDRGFMGAAQGRLTGPRTMKSGGKYGNEKRNTESTGEDPAQV
jgi:hypothetical protein